MSELYHPRHLSPALWSIAGTWSGKFLMIRPAREEESVARKATQRA